AAAGRNPAGRLGAAQASGLVPPGTRSGREVPGSRDVADPRDPYGGGARGDQRSWGDRESPDSRERRDPWGEPGSRRDTRGYRPHRFGDSRDSRDARDPRESRDYRDNHRPRPGGAPRDIW